MTAWAKAIGTSPDSKKKVADVLKEAEIKETQQAGGGDYHDGYDTEWKYPELRDALLAVAGEHGRINCNRLAFWLRGNKGKIVGGLRLANDADEHRHTANWWVET